MLLNALLEDPRYHPIENCQALNRRALKAGTWCLVALGT